MRYFLLFILFIVSLTTLKAQKGNEKFLEYYNEYQARLEEEDYLNCILILEESLSICTEISEYSKGWIHNNIGRVYWKIGDFRNATDQYRKAIAHVSGNDLSSSYLLNSIYNNLAIIYRQIEIKDRALTYYNEADRILKKMSTIDDDYLIRLSAGYLNRAIVYYEMNEFITAIDLLNKAKKLKEENKQQYIGSVYYNLARCYEEIGKLELADSNYNRSIEQWISEQGENYYQLANIYMDYASFLLKYNPERASLKYFTQAIEIYLKDYGEKNAFLSYSYAHLAEYYLYQNDYIAALKNIQSSLLAICPDYDKASVFDNPEICESLLEVGLVKNLHKKADLLFQAASADSATVSKLYAVFNLDPETPQKRHLLEFALETNSLSVSRMQQLHQDFPSRNSQLFLLENSRRIYLTGIQIAYALYESTGLEKYKQIAYAYSSESKAFVLDFEKQEKERIFLSSQTDSSSIQMIGLINEISAYENLIQSANLVSAADSMKYANWQKELFSQKVKYEDAILEFRKSKERIDSEKVIDEGRLIKLQKKLRSKETIIEYTLSSNEANEQCLYTFLIDRKNIQLLKQELDSSFIQDCEFVSRLLQNPELNTNTSNQKEGLYPTLSRIYFTLFGPIENQIRGKDLIIIPEEQLLDIPFDALLVSDSKEAGGTHFLIEDHAISYLHSSREYTRSIGLRLRNPSMTAIAPVYSNLEAGPKLLHGSLSEAKNAARIFKGKLLNDISKAELKEHIKTKDIIHFAMHAVPGGANASPNLILNSKDDSLFNNRLFDYEVNTLNSNAELVVLSSCETAVGEHFSGEGNINMSRSFSLAGAKAVIHSLWLLDDGSSVHVMSSFYKNLRKGKSKAAALRKAKLEYLEEQSPGFHHPYYWAGYQIYGDTTRVVFPRWLLLLGLGMVITGIFSVVLWSLSHRGQDTQSS